VAQQVARVVQQEAQQVQQEAQQEAIAVAGEAGAPEWVVVFPAPLLYEQQK